MQVIFVAHKMPLGWVLPAQKERLINQLGQGVNKTEITRGREQFLPVQALGTPSLWVQQPDQKVRKQSSFSLSDQAVASTDHFLYYPVLG